MNFGNRSLVTNCCLNKIQSAYGFIWRYKNHVYDTSDFFELKYDTKFSSYKINKCGIIINKHGKKLTPFINGGYYHVTITSDLGKSKTVKVHRVVAYTFIENPNNYNIVNHKDRNKLNNNVNNLEWCTNAQNVTHACGKKVMRIDPKTEDTKIYNSFTEASKALGKKHLSDGIRKVCNGERKFAYGYKIICRN